VPARTAVASVSSRLGYVTVKTEIRTSANDHPGVPTPAVLGLANRSLKNN